MGGPSGNRGVIGRLRDAFLGARPSAASSSGPTTTPPPAPGLVCATLDAPARFHLDALRWFITATELAGIEPTELAMAVVGPTDAEVPRTLAAAGVRVVPVEAFDERSPHCNKIAGALAVAAQSPTGPVALTDLDLAFLADPRRAGAGPGTIAGKTVDSTVPKLPVLDAVFEAAGLALPPEVETSFSPVGPTRQGNFNGGLYVVDGSDLPALTEAWARWARWLLERRELLDKWAIHVDQVSNLLALTELGLRPELLDGAWNQATHKPDQLPAPEAQPKVLHYHTAIDTIGRLQPAGHSAIDDAVGLVNAAIDDYWQRAFPNETFWTWRYETNPDLGSGVGSRGDALAAKHELFGWLETTLAPSRVIDVGCGDGEASAGHWADADYTGLDLSPAALAVSKARRDQGTFIRGSAAAAKDTADLTLCLDVLIHQPTAAAYESLVADLLATTSSALLVSGYEQDPNVDSPMVHFHESLSATLARLAPDAEVYPVLDTNGSVAQLVLKRPADTHARDATAESVAQIIAQHPSIRRMIELRLDARRTTGFYPDHSPRLWEYPWVADQLVLLVAAGGAVLDVGAGVNPLVPFLHRSGWSVHTVDNSTTPRAWPIGPDVNEWGYLDYAAADLATTSWNQRLDEVADQLPEFDAVFSVSVVEHLPAQARRALFADIAAALRAGGVAILTVDVTRDTDDLWNRSVGQVVDEVDPHGTFTELLAELAAVGLVVESSGIERNWGDEPVDIGWVVARRS